MFCVLEYCRLLVGPPLLTGHQMVDHQLSRFDHVEHEVHQHAAQRWSTSFYQLMTSLKPSFMFQNTATFLRWISQQSKNSA